MLARHAWERSLLLVNLVLLHCACKIASNFSCLLLYRLAESLYKLHALLNHLQHSSLVFRATAQGYIANLQ